jgi:hypothetical protein
MELQVLLPVDTLLVAVDLEQIQHPHQLVLNL